MAELGIMIEGQEGLTWEYWRALCRDVDGLDFASLRRSDHLFSVMKQGNREALECWISLGLAAEWTERVQIGPMVSPMTFRHPALAGEDGRGRRPAFGRAPHPRCGRGLERGRAPGLRRPLPDPQGTLRQLGVGDRAHPPDLGG